MKGAYRLNLRVRGSVRTLLVRMGKIKVLFPGSRGQALFGMDPRFRGDDEIF